MNFKSIRNNRRFQRKVGEYPSGTDSPLQRFSELWDRTIKRGDLRQYGYQANPWVWVIKFERCDKRRRMMKEDGINGD